MKKQLSTQVLQFAKCFLFLYLILNVSVRSQDSDADSEKYSDYSPDFNILIPQFYYFPEDTVKIKLESSAIRVVSEFTVKLYRITDPEAFITKQSNQLSFSTVGKDSSNLTELLEEKFSENIKIYPVKDKKSGKIFIRDTISVYPRVSGAYIVRVFLKNKVATAGFFVTSLSMITRITQSSILNYTCNRETGEPVDEVKLSLFIKGTKLGEIIPKGSVNNFIYPNEEIKFRLKKSHYLIIAQKDGEVAVSDPELYFRNKPNFYNAYIITSQPVYRPPAKVDFKISVRDITAEGYRVHSGKNIIVYVKDSKGAGVYRKLVKTDDYGTFSDSVIINRDSPLGDYTITAEVINLEDTLNTSGTNEVFSQVFGVEEYKKPEYKVEVTTDKEQYGGKDKIKINVQSDYYFGSPVQQGEVKYKILKKPLYRPWWYYSEYRWWYEAANSGNNDFYNSVEIYYGDGVLNEEGNLEISYLLNENFRQGDEKNYFETDFQYIITAYVKDKSRQNVIGIKTVNVTRSDYFINSHSDRYVVRPGEKIGVSVQARDFSDKPVEAPFIITVNRITYEKNKKITNFAGTYSGKTFTTGTAVIFVDTDLEGYYEMEINSFDSKGTKISDKAGSFVSSGKYDWWYQSGTIEIIPDKDIYSPGDTMSVLVSIPHKNANLLVTNYNKDIISYSVEKFEDNSAYIKVPVSDGSAPNFFISASYVYKGSYYENSRSIAVIPVKKLVEVELSSDKQVYKPREEGVVKIAVKDKLGNPVRNSEVTLGMIDESIYAIRDETVKDIRTVFYSPSKDNTKDMFNYTTRYREAAGSYYKSLFEMYNYPANSNVCTVSGKIYDEHGNDFSSLSVIINESYFAGKSNPKGEFSFIIPEGDQVISLASGPYNIPGKIKVHFKKNEPNILKIKSSLSGIRFASINDEIITTEAEIKEYTNKNGTISGTIVEAGTLLPIRNAVVKVEGTKLEASTNEEGYFEINDVKEGIYNVIVIHPGYESIKMMNIEILKAKGVNLAFQLSNSTVIMTDMVEVVTSRNSINPDQSGKIITSEQINEEGIKGIQNLVSKTSGIVEDEPNAQINLRGGRTTVSDMTNQKEEYVDAVVRNDFRDKILWMPSVYTDANGYAEVKVKFPDNLTTWRLTARAITKNTDVGQNTYSIIARKDLIIRVEAPRFFQQSDEVTVSTIIHNYLDEEKKTKISLSLQNLMLAGTTPYVQEITLGKNEERRIDWPVKVFNPVGTGTVFASALTNEESDAMEQYVPIQPFGLKTKKFQSYDFSQSTVNTTKTFEIPERTDTKSSSLVVNVSPSLASSILGALEYLMGYPYGCIEQTMSRFMPTVIAASTLKEMNAPPDPFFDEQLPVMVKKGLEKIYSMQAVDGGWSWWTHGKSDIYMTSYVVYSLMLAGSSGYKTDIEKFNNGISFLRSNLNSKKTDIPTKAFALFVLTLTDTSANKQSAKLLEKISAKQVNPLAMAWLSLAAGKLGDKFTQQRLITQLMREVNYTEDGGAFWGGKIKKYEWQNDNFITTSMVIKALMADPASSVENKDMIEKAVKWFLDQKKSGSWGNTLQNAFIVYSLCDYIKTYNELEPDYELKIFVNDSLRAEKHVTREDIFKIEERFVITGKDIKNGLNNVRIEKSGTGKAYITTELTYYEAESTKKIEETDEGFDIERSYFRLYKVYDKKKKIYFYKKEELKNSTSVSSGEELFVKIKVYPSKKDNEYFMLEDPIPAGCEYIKEDWAYAIDGENSYSGRSSGLWNWWYSDKDVRDNRIVFFASELGEGEYEFTYLLRAQIPGTYNIMPARGELMYYPEINGSSKNLTLKIIDK